MATSKLVIVLIRVYFSSQFERKSTKLQTSMICISFVPYIFFYWKNQKNNNENQGS